MNVFGTVLTISALGAGAWALVMTLLNRALLPAGRVTFALLGLLGALELGLLAHFVAELVAMLSASRHFDRVVFVVYLLATLLVLPCTTFWALAERSRWGSGVLLVGCLAVPVLILRLHQVWSVNV